MDDLEDHYLEHVLDEAGISVQAARRTTLDLHDLLHSCPDLNHASTDDFLHQQECGWFSGGGYAVHRGQTDYNPGYDESQGGLSAGIQREVGDDLFVELAGVFDLFWLDGDNFDQNGYRAYGGAVVKKEIDNFTLSATLSGGIFGYDYTRTYTTLGGVQSASSNPFGGFVGGELRASAIFNRDLFYAKPSLALTAVQIWQQSFSERGSGGLEWDIDGVSESYFAIRPAIEFGRSFTGQRTSGDGLSAHRADRLPERPRHQPVGTVLRIRRHRSRFRHAAGIRPLFRRTGARHGQPRSGTARRCPSSARARFRRTRGPPAGRSGCGMQF